MSENPLHLLEQYGQSIWIDFIRRGTLLSGELKRWIDEDGVTGVTSNPSIFDKAIGGSHDYDTEISELATQGKNIEEIYTQLTVEDIQNTADLFRPTFDRLEGKDGFVSLEVSPGMARDTQGSVDEAHQLWNALNRPNVMIKVPGTSEGLGAIRQLTADGLNINITLLFGLPRYREVIDAYLSGLEDRVARGLPLKSIHSVASFFLSRIDVLLDPELDRIQHQNWGEADRAKDAIGHVAISSAKVAYQIFNQEFQSDRFKKLAALGANPQRLLWASTSTKNPAYSDVKYVDALIGPQTVNTLPVETLNAYRDHGHPAPRLADGADEARRVLRSLVRLGIDLDQATKQLEDEGVEKFEKAFSQLMASIKEKREAAIWNQPLDRQILKTGPYTLAVQNRLDEMSKKSFMDRLWRRDGSLWKDDPQSQKQIRNALGWLHVAEKMEESIPDLEEFRRHIVETGFKHVVHMGMGGSSLAPLVLSETIPPAENGLPLTVLDTTDPVTITSLAKTLPLKDTLFIVASKSGTTVEASAFEDYFYTKVKEITGDQAGDNFVAITDPDTLLVKSAEARRYRRVFCNFADIGGRYSALSFFGMVPAALLGIDLEEFLSRALRMQHACDTCVPPGQNPGLVLGSVLGTLATQGRDKVTFVLPETLASLGMWLEQLLAESTGKEGAGVIPVAGEVLGDPEVYGDDRLFVYICLRGLPDEDTNKRLSKLEKAGHPLVRIELADILDISEEFFRWEITTAVAGSILGINPFDQPNVQESKDNTNRLLKEINLGGRQKEVQPTLREGNIELYADENSATLSETLKVLLDRASPGDYLALLAYLSEDAETTNQLQTIRRILRDRTKLATTLGYGPRYLHSTGQLHKGGPNTGIFLMFTKDTSDSDSIPGHPYSFGALEHAQAIGDYEALQKHGRRVIRLHMKGEIKDGLERIKELLLL